MCYGTGRVIVTVMTQIPNETIKQGFTVHFKNLVIFTILPFTYNSLHYCNVCGPAD
jgi:hypothetical protein